MLPPGAREIPDPEAEMERLAAARKRWMPSILCEEIHQLEHDGRLYFLRVTVSAELTGDEPAGFLPVRADLGKRIADMIRADCAKT